MPDNDDNFDDKIEKKTIDWKYIQKIVCLVVQLGVIQAIIYSNYKKLKVMAFKEFYQEFKNVKEWNQGNKILVFGGQEICYATLLQPSKAQFNVFQAYLLSDQKVSFMIVFLGNAAGSIIAFLIGTRYYT